MAQAGEHEARRKQNHQGGYEPRYSSIRLGRQHTECHDLEDGHGNDDQGEYSS